jgi:hypothetical protein
MFFWVKSLKDEIEPRSGKGREGFLDLILALAHMQVELFTGILFAMLIGLLSY